MYDTNKIKKLRLDKAWSQEQLAEIASLSVRTIQRIENGSAPSFETVSAIAAAFDVKIKDLFIEQQNKKTDEKKDECAKKVERQVQFYRSLFSFLIISLLLFVINIITNSSSYWFIYPVFAFVICLVIKWLRLFIFNNKIERWKNKKLQKQ